MQNFGASMRAASAFDHDVFRQDTSRRLGPLLHRLSSLSKDTLSLGWVQYERYMEIMARRLKDTAGLHDPPEQSGEENAER